MSFLPSTDSQSGRQHDLEAPLAVTAVSDQLAEADAGRAVSYARMRVLPSGSLVVAAVGVVSIVSLAAVVSMWQWQGNGGGQSDTSGQESLDQLLWQHAQQAQQQPQHTQQQQQWEGQLGQGLHGSEASHKGLYHPGNAPGWVQHVGSGRRSLQRVPDWMQDTDWVKVGVSLSSFLSLPQSLSLSLSPSL